MSLAKMIGEQIRHYRNLRGLTQEQLAEILESHGTYIGRLERGEQNVQLATLEKIAEALHISVFAFFNHDQVRTPEKSRMDLANRVAAAREGRNRSATRLSCSQRNVYDLTFPRFAAKLSLLFGKSFAFVCPSFLPFPPFHLQNSSYICRYCRLMENYTAH